MYKITWIVVHAIFGFVSTLISWLTSFKQYLSSFYSPALPIEHDQLMIELSKTELIKIPKHIVIIFNDSSNQLEPLDKLVRWIVLTGVRYVSFYDYRGRFENIRPEVFTCMEQIRTQYKQQLSESDQSYDATFNYVDPTYNTALISEACRNTCKSGVRPGDITIPYVNQEIEKLMPDFPDPDLAIHFDEYCCTYGLSPWHIRLTEFAHVHLDPHLKLNSYLNVLYRYSKCEQRFGK